MTLEKEIIWAQDHFVVVTAIPICVACNNYGAKNYAIAHSVL